MGELLSFTKVEPKENLTDTQITLQVYEKITAPFTGSTVFFGVTPENGHVAVKISTHSWGPKREWQGLQMASKSGVPCPQPLGIVQDQNGRLGIMMDLIEGIQLYRLEGTDKRCEFGSIVKEMHNNVVISGNEWRNTRRADFLYYDKIMREWGSLDIDELKEGTKSRALLDHFVEILRDEFRNFVPVFNHRDLHDGQVIITNTNNLTIIDFEMWREEHPLDDVSIYLFHTLRTNRPKEYMFEFARGYLNGGSFSDQERAILAFYLLFGSLRSVDWYARFRKKDLPLAISQLEKVTQYIEEEKLWKEL